MTTCPTIILDFIKFTHSQRHPQGGVRGETPPLAYLLVKIIISKLNIQKPQNPKNHYWYQGVLIYIEGRYTS